MTTYSRNFGAQRKFAAGVYAPNKCQTSRSELPTESRPEPDPKVHIVKKTPSSLLDRVTFNDIHLHVGPVVLLERLHTNQVSNSQSQQPGPKISTDVHIEEDYTSQEIKRKLSTENTKHDQVETNVIPQDRKVVIETPNSIRARSISTSDEDIPIYKKLKTSVVDAPVFRPTIEEFQDPLTYIESILPEASKYGLCKVIPPHGFSPPCNLDETMGFAVTNQYVQRMFKRYGPATKELSAFKALLASQKVPFKRPPLVSGLEVDLPHLYKLVQHMGGLKKITSLPKWHKVAEQLKCCNSLKNPAQKIKQIYEKYLLPYEVMTSSEKRNLTEQVENLCERRYSRMFRRAKSPLHTQKQMLAQCDSTDNDSADETPITDRIIFGALAETEDCIVPGRTMKFHAFEKVAEIASQAFLSTTSQKTSVIEKEYWDLVLSRTRHVCVNAASIDTGASDYGFPNNNSLEHYNLHPWNLKRISKNTRNMLSFLGPVVGMTAPTLHLGMVFSTSCWHRDPHGLPWIEYMHKGLNKVWYGIDDTQSAKFRRAVERLCPAFSQNKSVWLPSDIVMIPPELLQQNSVSLCRAVQKPGEFVIVCPKGYSCSIATGFTIAESVYFATLSWIQCLGETFDTLKSSCEPTMFSLEQLLFAFVKDSRTPLQVLTAIEPILNEVLDKEFKSRRHLEKLGLAKTWHKPTKASATSAWNVCDQDECYICRMTLYLSRVRGVFDRNSVLCPQHALKILEQPKKNQLINEPKRLTFEMIYNTSELKELLEFLKERLKK